MPLIPRLNPHERHTQSSSFPPIAKLENILYIRTHTWSSIQWLIYTQHCITFIVLIEESLLKQYLDLQKIEIWCIGTWTKAMHIEVLYSTSYFIIEPHTTNTNKVWRLHHHITILLQTYSRLEYYFMSFPVQGQYRCVLHVYVYSKIEPDEKKACFMPWFKQEDKIVLEKLIVYWCSTSKQHKTTCNRVTYSTSTELTDFTSWKPSLVKMNSPLTWTS